jgi:hypothetical protein
MNGAGPDTWTRGGKREGATRFPRVRGVDYGNGIAISFDVPLLPHALTDNTRTK